MRSAVGAEHLDPCRGRQRRRRSRIGRRRRDRLRRPRSRPGRLDARKELSLLPPPSKTRTSAGRPAPLPTTISSRESPARSPSATQAPPTNEGSRKLATRLFRSGGRKPLVSSKISISAGIPAPGAVTSSGSAGSRHVAAGDVDGVLEAPPGTRRSCPELAAGAVEDRDDLRLGRHREEPARSSGRCRGRSPPCRRRRGRSPAPAYLRASTRPRSPPDVHRHRRPPRRAPPRVTTSLPKGKNEAIVPPVTASSTFTFTPVEVTAAATSSTRASPARSPTAIASWPGASPNGANERERGPTRCGMDADAAAPDRHLSRTPSGPAVPGDVAGRNACSCRCSLRERVPLQPASTFQTWNDVQQPGPRPRRQPRRVRRRSRRRRRRRRRSTSCPSATAAVRPGGHTCGRRRSRPTSTSPSLGRRLSPLVRHPSHRRRRLARLSRTSRTPVTAAAMCCRPKSTSDCARRSWSRCAPQATRRPLSRWRSRAGAARPRRPPGRGAAP